jgi:hypothetical protein
MDNKANKDVNKIKKIINSIAIMQLTYEQRRKEREEKGVKKKE